MPENTTSLVYDVSETIFFSIPRTILTPMMVWTKKDSHGIILAKGIVLFIKADQVPQPAAFSTNTAGVQQIDMVLHSEQEIAIQNMCNSNDRLTINYIPVSETKSSPWGAIERQFSTQIPHSQSLPPSATSISMGVVTVDECQYTNNYGNESTFNQSWALLVTTDTSSPLIQGFINFCETAGPAESKIELRLDPTGNFLGYRIHMILPYSRYPEVITLLKTCHSVSLTFEQTETTATVALRGTIPNGPQEIIMVNAMHFNFPNG